LSKESKVFVVIVTYNGMKWIDECLKSVQDSSIAASILIIDNCSQDGTTEFISANFKQAEIIKNTQNLGFGKANNVGIAKAVAAGADYVLLLNQDAYLFPDCIEKLIQGFNQNSSYGVLSPIQLQADGKKMENLFYQFNADFFNQLLTQSLLAKPQSNTTIKVEFVQAACWLIKKEVFTKIDGFDDLFYHYGEDNNFCQRLKYLGYDIGIVTDSFVTHDTTDETHKKRTIKYELNRYRSNILKYIYDVNEPNVTKHYSYLLKKCYVSILTAIFTLSPKSAYVEAKKLILLIRLIFITKNRLTKLK
jgi:GT2 family glycosyltransferase